jgi:amidophosphoribosyltransferase
MKVNNVPLYKNKDKDGSYAVKFKSYYRHDLKIKEECAVFGINDNDDAAALTALGLHALQHRGQEGCGIVTYDKKKFYSEKRLGLVGDNFTKAQTLDKLPGNAAIGHNRYSTSGGDTIRNVQPFFADIQGGGISIAHNGNLTNALMLRETLVKDGAIFHTTSDTETIVQLIARSKKIAIIDKIIDALWQIQGGYALTILSNEVLIGVRDPFGIRPLVLGKLNHSYIITSETCALDIIGAKYLREIENGEIVVIKNGKMRSIKPFPSKTKRPCIFEYIYFARPDSILQDQCAYEYRKNLGTQLAKECDINPDIVVPVPDSGVPSALGFSQATDKNFELGLIRNHYVGRTFIEPSQNIRSLGVKLKLNANKSSIKDKVIALIDDSLVRGTTCHKIIKMLYDAGAKEVHVRIACPEIKFPDFYGVDTPTKKELLAANKSNEEICKYIGAKSLKFLSLDGLYRAMGYEKRNNEKPQFSDHHFTGDYPIKPLDNLNDDKIIQLSLLSLASSH